MSFKITDDRNRLYLIHESYIYQDKILALFVRNEAMLGNGTPNAPYADFCRRNIYVIDGIDIRNLHVFLRPSPGMFEQIANSKAINELRQEAFSVLGPIVGDLFVTCNDGAIGACSRKYPTFEEMHVRGELRKPPYKERYRKIHATYCHAKLALGNKSVSSIEAEGLKNIMNNALKDYRELNEDNALRKERNSCYNNYAQAQKYDIKKNRLSFPAFCGQVSNN